MTNDPVYPLAPYTTKEYSLSALVCPAPNLSIKNFSSWWSVNPSHFLSTKETLPSKNSSAKLCSTIYFASMLLIKLCGGSAKSVGCTCMFCPAFILQLLLPKVRRILFSFQSRGSRDAAKCLSRSLSFPARSSKWARRSNKHHEQRRENLSTLLFPVLCLEKESSAWSIAVRFFSEEEQKEAFSFY